MNARTVSLLSALLLLMAIGTGFCYPSLVGPVGLAVHPTADVPAAGEVDLSVDFQDTKDFFGEIWLSRLTFGATDRLEVSVGYTAVQGQTSFDEGRLWQVAAKYLLLDRPDQGLKVAAGTGYLQFTNSWDVHGFGGYVVASKDLTSPERQRDQIRLRGHLGVIYGGFKEHEGLTEFSDTVFRPWLGLEAITPRGTTLAVEYRPRTSSFETHDIVGAVLRHPFTERLSAEVGTTNVFSDGEEQAVFLGLSYRLSGQDVPPPAP
jgi:hypothetical protein